MRPHIRIALACPAASDSVNDNAENLNLLYSFTRSLRSLGFFVQICGNDDQMAHKSGSSPPCAISTALSSPATQALQDGIKSVVIEELDVKTDDKCNDEVLVLLATSADTASALLPSQHSRLCVHSRPRHQHACLSFKDRGTLDCSWLDVEESEDAPEGCVCRHLSLFVVVEQASDGTPTLGLSPSTQAAWETAISQCPIMGFDQQSAWINVVELLTADPTLASKDTLSPSSSSSSSPQQSSLSFWQPYAKAVEQRCSTWISSLSALSSIPRFDEQTLTKAGQLTREGFHSFRGMNGRPNVDLAIEKLTTALEMGYIPAVVGLHHILSQQGYGTAADEPTCFSLRKLADEVDIRRFTDAYPEDSGSVLACAWIFAISKPRTAEPMTIFQLAQKAAMLDSNNFAAILLIAGLLFATGDPDKVSMSYHIVLSVAEKGFTEAMFQLGWRLYDRPMETETCLLWLRRGAELGNLKCQTLLGQVCKEGRSVEPDLAQAEAWFRKAANAGHPLANYELGMMYFNGIGMEKNVNEALRYLLSAARSGQSPAEHIVGMMYLDGVGVEQDYAEAARWIRRSAGHGSTDAKYELGLMYEGGIGVDRNMERAIKWQTRAAEAGHTEAQLRLAETYENGNGVHIDLSQAVTWYRRAAESGDPSAQCRLGQMYELGIGVDGDVNMAASLYRKAAEAGHADAQYRLGYISSVGVDAPGNQQSAVDWFRKAADQGHEMAQLALISVYFRRDTPTDDVCAVEICRKYADGGNSRAQMFLGRMYMLGRGVAHCNTLAVKWLRQAERSGVVGSRELLDEIYTSERSKLKRSWEQFAGQ
jgi:TPR repeat protein